MNKSNLLRPTNEQLITLLQVIKPLSIKRRLMVMMFITRQDPEIALMPAWLEWCERHATEMRPILDAMRVTGSINIAQGE